MLIGEVSSESPRGVGDPVKKPGNGSLLVLSSIGQCTQTQETKYVEYPYRNRKTAYSQFCHAPQFCPDHCRGGKAQHPGYLG
ncbi:MAG: hypothetical protein Hals2KO_13270 [Halioglobus sp.]